MRRKEIEKGTRDGRGRERRRGGERGKQETWRDGKNV